MIRARSPFFFYSFFLTLIFGVSFAMLWFTRIDPKLAVESWIRTPKLDLFRNFGWLFLGVSLSGLIPIGVIEYFIVKGWEPKWLRQFHSCCTVQNIYSVPQDAPGHMRIEVVNQKNRTNWYILDPQEVSLCTVGDLVHIWAIGKHVANIIVLEKMSSMQISNPATSTSEHQANELAVIFMSIAPFIAGGIIGKGLEHAIFGEMCSGSKRKYDALMIVTGLQVHIIGGVMILAGFVIGGILLHKWVSGWDGRDSSLETLANDFSRPNPNFGYRRWWF